MPEPESANVRSIEAIRYFRSALLVFQEEARLCVSSLEMQLHRIMGWLERDRPGFWKREIETCYRELEDARVRLHQCRMRKYGDHKPTCFEEKKAHEKAKKDLEFAQKQVPVVKYWNTAAQQEANEYHGRASRMTQLIEREIPRLLALLTEVVDRLEAYGHVQVPGASGQEIQFTPADHQPTSDDPSDTESSDPPPAEPLQPFSDKEQSP